LVLAGCTPGDGITPSVDVPTVEVTVTPTPQWSADEQAAVDAVQAYLEMWAYIAQNIGEDPNQIFEVAMNPIADQDFSILLHWKQGNRHLVGGPEFTPTIVHLGTQDDLGRNFYVYGCYTSENSYLAEADGTPVPGSGHGTNRYTVLDHEGTWVVRDGIGMDDTC